jgi:hypothetical protein
MLLRLWWQVIALRDDTQRPEAEFYDYVRSLYERRANDPRRRLSFDEWVMLTLRETEAQVDSLTTRLEQAEEDASRLRVSKEYGAGEFGSYREDDEYRERMQATEDKGGADA